MNLFYYGYLSLLVSGILIWISNRETKDRNFALELSLVILVFGFLGARLTHVFYEDFSFYAQDWKRIFEIWRGGFVWYGAVILAGIASVLFIKLNNRKITEWADFMIIPISFGYGVGRLSCLIAKCCYGKSCDLPWAVTIEGIQRHPTQVYSSIGELILFSILLQVSKLNPRPGFLFSLWLFTHSLTRIFIESLRDDYRGESIIGLSLSTVISVVLLFAGGIMMILVHKDEFQIFPRKKY